MNIKLNPIDLVTRELTETLRLHNSVRKILYRRTRQIKKLMYDPRTPASQIPALTEELSRIIRSTGSIPKSVSGLILKSTPPASSDDPAMAVEVLEEMLHGKVRGRKRQSCKQAVPPAGDTSDE